MDWNVEYWEYVTFSVGLIILPLLVGLYHCFRRRSSTDYSSYAFVFGRKEIHPWQAMFSIGTVTSGPVVLLILSEFENSRDSINSLGSFFYSLGFMVGFTVFVLFFVPILHYAKSPSIFGYIEERFRSGMLNFLVISLYFVSNVVYNLVIACLVSELTSKLLPIPKWSIPICYVVLATIPGLTGGLNGVLDLFFYSVPLGQLIPISVLVAFGFTKLLPTAADMGEIKLNESAFEVDDINLWLIIPFAFLSTLHFFGANQNVYQSFAPAVTKKRARTALVLSLPVTLILFALAYAIVILIRASLLRCDLSEAVFEVGQNPWANLKSFIEFVWDEIPGLTGLIICALSTFGLCLLSANFLGVTTVLWEATVSNLFSSNQEKRQILAIQGLLTAYAILIGSLACSVFVFIPEPWIYAKLILLTSNSILAPLTAVFVAGMFMPCSNGRGAIGGFLIGILVTICFCGGHFYLHGDQLFGNRDIFRIKSNCSSEIPSNSTSEHSWNNAIDSPILMNSRTLNESIFVSSPLALPTTLSETSPTEPTSLLTTISGLFNRSEVEDSMQQMLAPELTDNAPNKGLTTNSTGDQLLTLPQSHFLHQQNETQNGQLLESIFGISPLLHPIMGFVVSLVLIFLISIITGGNDVYALDWNLVHWTCNDCTQRLRCRTEKGSGRRTALNGLQSGKRRNRRGMKSFYTTSESFRYARQAPYSDSNYQNPRVKNLTGNKFGDTEENTTEINTNTSSTSVGGPINQKKDSNIMQTKSNTQNQDFFSTLRPYTEVL